MKIVLLSAEDAHRVSIAVYGVRDSESGQLFHIPKEMFGKTYEATLTALGCFYLTGENVLNVVIPVPFVRYVYD